MSENDTRRAVLKKLAGTAVVGGGLLGSTGTAAAADSSYDIEVGLKAGSDGYHEYRLFVPYGDDGNWGVTGDSNTEREDSLYADDSRGGVEITGSLDASASNYVDTWHIDSMGSNYQIDYKSDSIYVEDTQ